MIFVLILLGYLFFLSLPDGDGKTYDMVAMIRYIWYLSHIAGLLVFFSLSTDGEMEKHINSVPIIRLYIFFDIWSLFFYK
jgi:hypothetical protein